jgi:propionyl-CoA carboxylase alpha chain
VGYTSAGTVEFIVDAERNFYFLEMNTRLQVEHPVTELITGLDLVELMLRVAAGEKLPLSQDEVQLNGWAIESRLYAEDPYRNFLPSTGRLTRYRPPTESARGWKALRNDTGVFEGGEISTFYDPMIAKLCTWALTREEAIVAMSEALDRFEVQGVGHNLPFLSTVMRQDRFREGRLTTGYIAEEFPEGFRGADLDLVNLHLLAQVAAVAWHQHQQRFANGSNQAVALSVIIGQHQWDIEVAKDEAGWIVNTEGKKIFVTLDWTPKQRLAEVELDRTRLFLNLQVTTSGFRIRHRGADLDVMVLRPHVAALLPLMPVKVPPDMSRFLLCPMPGQVVRIDVSEGDIVEDGQTLAIVEAMKMENVLKAEKRARVSKVHAQPGAVLAVDAVILEFEAV